MRQFAAIGIQAVLFEIYLDRDLYFAGSVERRTRELEEMFTRDEVRAILCARGGYGSNYLLDRIDLKNIKAHPKIFVGYSDLTTLLTYFADQAGRLLFKAQWWLKILPIPTASIWFRGNTLCMAARNGRSSRMRK